MANGNAGNVAEVTYLQSTVNSLNMAHYHKYSLYQSATKFLELSRLPRKITALIPPCPYKVWLNRMSSL